MIKSGAIKSVFLMALIGILLIALVEPISANGQTDTVNSGADSQTPRMHCMIGEHSVNKTMMSGMMGEHSAKKTMMPSMMDQNASKSQAGPDCSRFWLQQAIALHDLHMRDPKVAANKSSQIELMNQMKRAYECDTGKNITENTATGMMNQKASTSQGRSSCANLWLKKAIELHDLHLNNPKAAANESSQMVMMNQMIKAYDCTVNKTKMGMNQSDRIAQARMDCADFWLKKAIKLHEVHLKNPSTATEKSQMEMMDQMMLAHQCIKGEKITTGMTNTTDITADHNTSEGH